MKRYALSWAKMVVLCVYEDQPGYIRWNGSWTEDGDDRI